MNNGIHVSFSILISSGHMPRRGISGSYGGFIPFKGISGKGNPLTLLVGMQTSTAAMENSVEIS